MASTSPVRIDRWLWAVRAFKTRAQANDACTRGRVRVNGEISKPATKVRPGDRVEARLRERSIVYEVVQTIEKRVGAAIAAEAFTDHSPPPPVRPASSDLVYPAGLNGGARDRGSGRPTKRDRRQMDKLRKQ